MPCRLQISHRRKRSRFSFLSVSTLLALLRPAPFVVVALPKPQLSFALKVKRFSVLLAVRAGIFTFSRARSKIFYNQAFLVAVGEWWCQSISAQQGAGSFPDASRSLVDTRAAK